ncbi:MAG: hypothetical protein Q4G04_04200 [bacterium]|nr:hypothetical protein [bacterium]
MNRGKILLYNYYLQQLIFCKKIKIIINDLICLINKFPIQMIKGYL